MARKLSAWLLSCRHSMIVIAKSAQGRDVQILTMASACPEVELEVQLAEN